jgi:hypothetical protein
VRGREGERGQRRWKRVRGRRVRKDRPSQGCHGEGVRARRGTNGVRSQQGSESGQEAGEGRGLVHLEAVTKKERGGWRRKSFFTLG